MSDRLRGRGISPGTATGRVAAPLPSVPLPAARRVVDPAHETVLAGTALSLVAEQATAEAEALGDGPAAHVLRAQALLAGDPLLIQAIATHVDGGLDAPHALDAAFADHRVEFIAAGGLLAERVGDLDDLRDRAVAACLGSPSPSIGDSGEPVILVAAHLAPAVAARFNPDRVGAVVTADHDTGGQLATVARAAGIPAIAGCAGSTDLPAGTRIRVDGDTGDVRIGVPAEPARPRTGSVLTEQGHTRDGHPVALRVDLDEIDTLSRLADTDEVGLFRTEPLHRGNSGRWQRARAGYRRLFTAADGRPLTIRTLDTIGTEPTEPHQPFGLRGMRLTRQDPAIMDEQLSAIAAAAADTAADVRVIAPMVSTPKEARDFAARAHAAGIETAGVLVEIPAAALGAPHILSHVDFIGIDIDRLSQYTFAADRRTAALTDLCDPRQPVLLQLIQCCADAAAAADKPASVCGTAAADPDLAVILTGMGITGLTMPARALPAVREALAEHTLGDCRRRADIALDQGALTV